MNRIAIAAIGLILVLFSSIPHARAGTGFEGEWLVASSTLGFTQGKKMTISRVGNNYELVSNISLSEIQANKAASAAGGIYSGGPNQLTHIEPWTFEMLATAQPDNPRAAVSEVAAKHISCRTTLQLSSDGGSIDYTSDNLAYFWDGYGELTSYQYMPAYFREHWTRISPTRPSRERNITGSATGDRSTATSTKQPFGSQQDKRASDVAASQIERPQKQTVSGVTRGQIYRDQNDGCSKISFSNGGNDAVFVTVHYRGASPGVCIRSHSSGEVTLYCGGNEPNAAVSIDVQHSSTCAGR